MNEIITLIATKFTWFFTTIGVAVCLFAMIWFADLIANECWIATTKFFNKRKYK